MKKRISFFVLCIIFFFAGLARCDEPLRRSLFVSLVQDVPALSSRKDINKLIEFSKKTRIKILFVQIYRSNQAWFPSKIADSGPYEASLKDISGGPFTMLIRKAHKAGIEVHAWLNVLSLGANKDAIFLKKYGPEILTRNLKKKKNLEDYKIDNQYFLEPADPEARRDLMGIVEEILRAYPDLDGLLFDYVRYPDRHPAYGYTKINIENFKKATGLKSIEENSQIWKDWKRAQVTECLKLLVDKARSIRSDIQISATGCMPYSRAYHEAFQDWPSWIDRGLVDFVTIMSYSTHPLEFKRSILTAKKKAMNFNKINIGIGAYKLIHSPARFKQEYRFCEKLGGAGCVFFHYGSLIQNPALGNFLISKKTIKNPDLISQRLSIGRRAE